MFTGSNGSVQLRLLTDECWHLFEACLLFEEKRQRQLRKGHHNSQALKQLRLECR